MARIEPEAQRDKGVAKPAPGPCQVTFMVADQVFSGTSLHFNEGGMLVLCHQPAQLYSKLTLTLKFPGLKNPLKLAGEVVWTNLHGPADSLSPRGMGVKFVNLDEAAEHVLQELARHYESLGNIYSCYYT